MSGLLTINVQEARGQVAVAANVDQLCVVVGCTSQGVGLSPFFLSGSAAVADRGYGDAVDVATQAIEQRQGVGGNTVKFPVAIYSVPVTTPASYGAVNNAGVTGTAVFSVDPTSLPFGTYDAAIRFIAGGVVGVAGITYQWALDKAQTWSNTTALGTATSITIPNSGAKFLIGLSVTGTTDATAGALYGGGGTLNAETLILNVNGAGPLTLTLSGAGNTATEVAFLAAIHAEWPAITATVVSTHLVLTVSPGNTLVIGAGTANAALGLTASTVIATVVANDTSTVRTFGPTPSTADIDTAFVALKLSAIDFRLLAVEMPMSAATAAHITTGLNTLLLTGKRATALVRTRIPTFESAETDAAWNTSIAADWLNFADDRIVKRATYELITDALTTRQYLRSDFAQFVADTVRSPRFTWPGAPADPVTSLAGISNVSLVDASGNLIGHDEGPLGSSTGLSDPTLGNTFSCVQRIPDASVRQSVFNCVPWTSYGPGSTIQNLMTRRLANAMESVAIAAGISLLGGTFFGTATSPTTGTLSPQSRKALQAVIFAIVSAEFAQEISNSTDADLDTGLVQINPSCAISGGNLIGVTGTLAPRVGKFLLSLGLTLAVLE